MSAADVTPERFAELRLLEKHLCASGQMVGACLRESLAALESAWAERDAYLDEVRMTNENEARIMADLLATREERDKLRAELDRISAQGVEVPEITDDDIEEIYSSCDAAHSLAGIARRAYALAVSRLRSQPSATPPRDVVEVSRAYLNAMEGCILQTVDQLQGGFVVCRRCGDQEDTATLDVMQLELLPMAERIRALRAKAQPATEREGA